MSLGVGIGDIITVTNLAWNTVQHVRQACGEYDELTRDASNIHTVLHKLQQEAADPESIINRSNDDHTKEITQLVAGCTEVLKEVDSIISKYNALGDNKHGKGKRAWQRIKFGNDEMQELTELRHKLGHHTASITLFLNILSMGSQGRIEKQMKHQGGDLNDLRLTVNSMLARMMSQDQSVEGSVLTMFSGDDQSVWKSLRRELIKDGYDSSVISQHMDTIKAYIKELADRGVVDEPCDSNQEQILQPTIDEYTRKQLVKGKWQKTSKHEPQRSVTPSIASSEFVPEFNRISRMHNSTDAGPYSEQSGTLGSTISAGPLMNASVEFQDPVQELQHLLLDEEYSRVTTPVPQNGLPKLNDRKISCSETSNNNDAEHKRTSLRLKKLWPETGSTDFNSTFNVITISEGRDNPFSTTSWHRLYADLSASVAECQVFRYDYQISDSAGPVWANLVFQGQLFLQTVFGHKDGSLSQPLMFLCYGLGGLVLKRALALAYEKPVDPASQFLIAMNSGIVFLGTPHPLYIDCSQWARLNLILKLNACVSQSFLAEAERDVARMANVSSGFDKLRLKVPIMSVYEEKESRIRLNYWRSIKVVLVDRSLASTSQRPQTLLGINSDHAHLCRITAENTSFRSELHTLVTTASRKEVDKASGNDPISLELSQLRPLTFKPSRHIEVPSESYATPFSTYINYGPRYPEGARLLPGKRKSKSLAGVVGQGVEVDLEPPMLVSPTRRKAPPKLPCYVLQQESTNPEFWGRRNILTQIDDILLPIRQESHVLMATTRSPCVVLGGIGGIGKTQIAMHYALTRKPQFDAIFWVQANNDATIAQGFINIAENLGLVSSSETVDPVFCRSLALEWLSLPTKPTFSQHSSGTPVTTGASYLLIFDNADDPEITRQYWPISRTGAILITSRCPWMSQSHYQSIHIPVEPLSPDDGGAMLRKLVFHDNGSENAKSSVTIATKLGGHPLAIVQLAGLINSKNPTAEQSLDIYEKQIAFALNRRPSQPASTENNNNIYSMITVWDQSLGELSVESNSLLQTISFLEPCRIPENIMLAELNGTIELPFVRTAEVYSKARGQLYASSLIQWFEESEEISIYCLIQEVVIHRMSDSDTLVAFGQAVYLVRQAWPDGKDWLLGDPPKQALLERLVPHVQKLKLEYEKLDATSLNLETKIAMAELLQTSGWYMAQKRAYSITHLFFSHALAICEKHTNALRHVHADLSFCYASMGALTNQKPSAILAYASRHLHLRRELDDSSEAAKQLLGLAHCELGYAYLLTGEFSKAIEHCRMAKAINSKARTADSDDTWSYRADVYEAWSLAANGRLDESELLLLSTLRTTNEDLETRNGDNYRLGTILKCLGFLRAKQGLMEESLNAYEEAIVNFVASVGHNSYETSIICVKLGEHNMLERQLETASIYFEQALRGFTNHGWSSEDIARTTYKLSLLRDAQGDYIGSQIQLQKAEELYHQLVPSADSNQQLSEAHFDSLVLMTSR